MPDFLQREREEHRRRMAQVSTHPEDPCVCRKAGGTGEDCPWKCPPFVPVGSCSVEQGGHQVSSDIQFREDIADLVRRVRIGLDEAEWAIRNGVPGLRQEEIIRRLRMFADSLVDAADALEASLNT